MCGIFGEFIFHGNFSFENCTKRLDLLKHRGPDGYGLECGNFLEKKYLLCHNHIPQNSTITASNNFNYFIG